MRKVPLDLVNCFLSASILSRLLWPLIFISETLNPLGRWMFSFFFQPLYFPFYILALNSAPMTLLVQQNDPTIGFANGDKSICFAV